jgi:hypothetical protein
MKRLETCRITILDIIPLDPAVKVTKRRYRSLSQVNRGITCQPLIPSVRGDRNSSRALRRKMGWINTRITRLKTCINASPPVDLLGSSCIHQLEQSLLKEGFRVWNSIQKRPRQATPHPNLGLGFVPEVGPTHYFRRQVIYLSFEARRHEVAIILGLDSPFNI